MGFIFNSYCLIHLGHLGFLSYRNKKNQTDFRLQDEAELVSKVYSALVNACGIMACVMGIVIIQALDNKVKNMYYNFDSIYAVFVT